MTYIEPLRGAVTMWGQFPNAAGQSLTLPNLSKVTVKIQRNPLLRFLSMIQEIFVDR